MKKISCILGIIGGLLIVAAIILLVFNNNPNNNSNNKKKDTNSIPWNSESQKGKNTAKGIKKYNTKSFDKYYIDQSDSLFHIIPQEADLCRIENSNIEYCNDKIQFLRYIYIVDNEKITSIIDSSDDELDNLNSYNEVLKYELKNENILLLEKRIDNGTYSETLHLFAKAFFKHYYYMYYYIENMSFDDSFISEIINTDKYQGDNKYLNQDGKWILYLNASNKKTFELNYDATKYFRTDYYQDYIFSLKTDKESDEVINLYFYYDKSGIDENLNTSFTIISNEKMKIKDYDVILYNCINKEQGKDYIIYEVMIDGYTKLLVSYPKNIADKVNINDFLNFEFKG